MSNPAQVDRKHTKMHTNANNTQQYINMDKTYVKTCKKIKTS
jgi:hypothetical protein